VNPRQRRGILLISLAGIGAVVVFVLVSNYLSDVRQQLGPTVAVLVSTDDLPPLATPDAAQLSTVEMPQRWLPPNALQSPQEIRGRIAAATIPANTILSEGMFLERPELEPGQREIAILVDAEIGVGGKITSGAIVDVLATFGGTEADGVEPGTPQSARVVLQRAEVIEVGAPVDAPEEGAAPGSVGFGSGQRLPVTFRLSIEDANRLMFVESFATSLRLALRSPLDQGLLEDEGASIFDQLDRLGRDFDPVGDGPVRFPELEPEPLEEELPPPPELEEPPPPADDEDEAADEDEQPDDEDDEEDDE
jgi:Flp pilus assembly protein CpaB